MRKNLIIAFSIFFMLGYCLVFTSCSDEDTASPFTINFTNEATAISASNSETDISITFSRAAPQAGAITMTIDEAGLNYGKLSDFYTNPEVVDNTLTVEYEAGDESATFTLGAGEALNIDREETIRLSLTNSNEESFVIGENKEIEVVFSENFIAVTGTLELNAGGESFPNQAFADLSKLSQTTVDKLSWDLGFSSAGGEYYVILNGSAGVMARALETNDLSTVSAQDTLGFGAEMVIGFTSSNAATAWVDTPDGNLETTAFGSISSTDGDNPVFIVKDATGTAWKKVRVLQNGENYTIQHADIAADDFTTTTINKDGLFNFTFLDLDQGLVEVEPQKDSWDIMYGTYTEVVSFGSPAIPYGFSDFIIINRNNTKIGMVLTENIAYDDFSSSNVADIDFKTEIDALGENWRQGGGPTSGPKLYEDRFFVLEDSQNNMYKILFTRLTSTSGERGYPEFTFKLVQ